MKTKRFGWTEVPVSAIGQGTWRMGEARRRRPKEIAALRCGLDLGMTHIDTAEMYGNGGAEELIAEALRGRGRERVFLVSKVLPEHASYRGTIAAAEQSLRRLRTEYLDLYLLHWRGRHPIGETMQAMEELVRQGKIRFFGVSNFDVPDLREAIDMIGPGRLACNQVLYHLGARGIEREIVPFCRQQGIAVVGYTPFGYLPRRGAALAALDEVAQRHGKTVRQIALAFLVREDGVFAIPKAADEAHVRENAGAGDVTLSQADIDLIDRAFPAPRSPAPLATA